MTDRLSLADWKAQQAAAHGFKRGNKYKNHRVFVDGFWFDSKLEAARYDELKLLRKSGEIAWFICQAPFRLPGGIIYRADFLVVWMDDSEFGRPPEFSVSVEDCKGARTRTSINKIKQVEAIYGIKVSVITRSNVR